MPYFDLLNQYSEKNQFEYNHKKIFKQVKQAMKKTGAERTDALIEVLKTNYLGDLKRYEMTVLDKKDEAMFTEDDKLRSARMDKANGMAKAPAFLEEYVSIINIMAMDVDSTYQPAFMLGMNSAMAKELVDAHINTITPYDHAKRALNADGWEYATDRAEKARTETLTKTLVNYELATDDAREAVEQTFLRKEIVQEELANMGFFSKYLTGRGRAMRKYLKVAEQTLKEVEFPAERGAAILREVKKAVMSKGDMNTIHNYIDLKYSSLGKAENVLENNAVEQEKKAVNENNEKEQEIHLNNQGEQEKLTIPDYVKDDDFFHKEDIDNIESTAWRGDDGAIIEEEEKTQYEILNKEETDEEISEGFANIGENGDIDLPSAFQVEDETYEDGLVYFGDDLKNFGEGQFDYDELNYDAIKNARFKNDEVSLKINEAKKFAIQADENKEKAKKSKESADMQLKKIEALKKPQNARQANEQIKENRAAIAEVFAFYLESSGLNHKSAMDVGDKLVGKMQPQIPDTWRITSTYDVIRFAKETFKEAYAQVNANVPSMQIKEKLVASQKITDLMLNNFSSIVTNDNYKKFGNGYAVEHMDNAEIRELTRYQLDVDVLMMDVKTELGLEPKIKLDLKEQFKEPEDKKVPPYEEEKNLEVSKVMD